MLATDIELWLNGTIVEEGFIIHNPQLLGGKMANFNYLKNDEIVSKAWSFTTRGNTINVVKDNAQNVVASHTVDAKRTVKKVKIIVKDDKVTFEQVIGHKSLTRSISLGGY